MVTGGKMNAEGLPTTGESPIADYMAAALLAFGVASALFRRERTGRGGRVDTSLPAVGAGAAEQPDGARGARRRPAPRRFPQVAGRGPQPGRVPFVEQAERMPRNRPVAMAAVYYRTYATKDAARAVACGSPSLRRKFSPPSPRGSALAGGVADVDAHYARLKVAVEATVASRTTEEWQAHMAKAGVPASRVALPLEILDDAQPAANGMFARQEHPALAADGVGPPVRLDAGGFVAGAPTAAFGSETA